MTPARKLVLLQSAIDMLLRHIAIMKHYAFAELNAYYFQTGLLYVFVDFFTLCCTHRNIRLIKQYLKLLYHKLQYLLNQVLYF